MRAVVTAAVRAGVGVRVGRAAPAGACGAGVEVDGTRLDVGQVVWACGPWLPTVLGEAVAPVGLRVTQQDVLFFGAGPDWATPPVPGWVDYDAAAYGLGDLDGRGVKCAPDVEGPPIDPEAGERTVLPDNLARARTYLARRFPALAGAPLIGSRTCPYTLTPDTAFVVAPHPAVAGSWVVGGGSGHAFKHGPVVGEHVADLVTGRAAPDPRFTLAPRAPAGALRTAGGGTNSSLSATEASAGSGAGHISSTGLSS
jgi:glycine/D-amino acid oxidase-like deaminating enzyme